jgi:hypothetical protein
LIRGIYQSHVILGGRGGQNKSENWVKREIFLVRGRVRGGDRKYISFDHPQSLFLHLKTGSLCFFVFFSVFFWARKRSPPCFCALSFKTQRFYRQVRIGFYFNKGSGGKRGTISKQRGYLGFALHKTTAACASIHSFNPCSC